MDALFQEYRLLSGLGKDGVQGPDQARFGAPVGVQFVLGVRGGGRFHVGADIRPAEAVNGLLRVADEEEPVALVPAEDPAEDLPLLGIGVLELIDQGGLVLLADRIGQGLARASFQGVGEPPDQVVVGLLFGVLLTLAHLGGRPLEERQMVGQGIIGGHLEQRFADLEQRRLGLGPGFLLSPGGAGVFLDCGEREELDGFPHVTRCGSGFKRGVQLGQACADTFGLGVLFGGPLWPRHEVIHERRRVLGNLCHLVAAILHPILDLSGNGFQPPAGRLGIESEIGISDEPLEHLSEDIGRDSFPDCRRGQRWLLWIDLPAEVVGGQFVQEFSLVRDQFHIEKNAAFKCPRPQCPLTERVDGINGNLVDQFQGKVQRLDSFLRLHLQQQRLQQVVLGSLVMAEDLCLAQFAFEGELGLTQPTADAPPKLSRGGFGISHHQDLGGGDIELEDQAEKHARQREGLAGARTGFQPRDASYQSCIDGIKRHGGYSCSFL